MALLKSLLQQQTFQTETIGKPRPHHDAVHPQVFNEKSDRSVSSFFFSLVLCPASHLASSCIDDGYTSMCILPLITRASLSPTPALKTCWVLFFGGSPAQNNFSSVNHACTSLSETLLIFAPFPQIWLTSKSAS
jgi:hypothetical protein